MNQRAVDEILIELSNHRGRFSVGHQPSDPISLEGITCWSWQGIAVNEPLRHFRRGLKAAPTTWLPTNDGVDPSAIDIVWPSLLPWTACFTQALDHKIGNQRIVKWLICALASGEALEFGNAIPLPQGHPGRFGCIFFRKVGQL